MRMSQDEKNLSHARIVEGASSLFRERGLDGTSVADVMRRAGLTHGGFYKHFATKDALVERALEVAFASFAERLEAGEATDALAAYRTLYLSQDHRDHPGAGCPAAALGSEIARAPDALKSSFGAGVRRIVGAIANGLNGTARARRAAAMREFSMLVGAIVIARASDRQTGDEVLAACQQGARNV